jgi:hypothetical protein
MAFGRHLRELFSHRTGLIVSLVVASLAALWSVGKVSIFPPSVKPRVVSMAAANTRALVDAPTSAVLDLKVTTTSLQGMSNRGVLVGNVMGSEPVRAYIARRAKIRSELLQVASPVTPDFPRPLATAGKKSPQDIAKSPNEYRLSIQANPTVPILDIYAEAPTKELAEQLANGAVDGMQDYLKDLAGQQHVPADRRVKLEQLGRAKGGVINPGVRLKLGLLTFLIVLGAASLTVLALDRVRQGWRVESVAQREAKNATV